MRGDSLPFFVSPSCLDDDHLSSLGEAVYYFSNLYTRKGFIVRLESSRAVIDTVMCGWLRILLSFMGTRDLTKSDALAYALPHLPL